MSLRSDGAFDVTVQPLWNLYAAAQQRKQLPTAAELETLAKSLGMVNIQRKVETEVFEYENGEAFITSPLVEDFLLPRWLESLDDEGRARVVGALCKLIDDEDGTLTFRFSVKVTLVTGEKG